MGGAARWSQIRALVSQRELEAAVRSGSVIRASRGVYSLPRPRVDQIAQRFKGVVSHHTAAEAQSLGTVRRQHVVDISVGSHRTVINAPEWVKIHYVDVPDEDVDKSGYTKPFRTAIDCARILSFPDALAIADCVVRTGEVGAEEFRTAANMLRGPGSRRVRRVADAIDTRAQSAMESLLRGILIDAGITCFVPQFEVLSRGKKIATTDLGDPETKTLLEADSFAWHGNRIALADDARRYDNLVALGYAVLRFAWEHLIGQPDWVVDTVRSTLQRRRV